MTPEEQKEFDELKTKAGALEGENAILKNQRDTYKNGFDSQTRQHGEAVKALRVAQAGYEEHLARIAAENEELKTKLPK